jgi:hypothetical protein
MNEAETRTELSAGVADDEVAGGFDLEVDDMGEAWPEPEAADAGMLPGGGAGRLARLWCKAGCGSRGRAARRSRGADVWEKLKMRNEEFSAGLEEVCKRLTRR